MNDKKESRGRPTGRQLLWAGGIVIVALAFLSIVICGYLFGLKWTGLPKKTFWDWLSILIVPAVLALGGYFFTRSESRRTRELADEHRQDDVLQAYLDGMSQLLTDKDRPLHRARLGDSLSTVARARTLSALERMNGTRRKNVLRFLYESRLIDKESLVVDLYNANLTDIYMVKSDLSGASLRGTYLSGANLREANLSRADLSEADLFSMADLDLSAADLSNADLSNADLRDAHLFIFKADLSNAQVITNEKLAQQTKHLKGATMPNGQKYEDWLKDREGRGEDGEKR